MLRGEVNMGETLEGKAAFDMRGLIVNSLLEWEDNLAAVAIAGGCNWRCPYCHSWRYVTGLDALPGRNPEDLFDLLKSQEGWIDGVVFSGGEPTLQPGLEEVIRRVKKTGVKVKLHTNGSRPRVVRSLLDGNLLDCLALDFKAPLDDRLFAAAGVAPDPALLEAVRESFRLAKEAAVDREYHTTLCPRFIDTDVLAEMAAFLDRDGTWFLQQFENGDCLDPDGAGGRRFTGKELDDIERLARERHGKVVMHRGKSA